VADERREAVGGASGRVARTVEPTAPVRPFSKHEAHPFEPADDPDAEVCSYCGELRVQIRHHPTRVAAARRLRDADYAPRASARRAR
jgi:hypothetical protein